MTPLCGVFYYFLLMLRGYCKLADSLAIMVITAGGDEEFVFAGETIQVFCPFGRVGFSQRVGLNAIYAVYQ